MSVDGGQPPQQGFHRGGRAGRAATCASCWPCRRATRCCSCRAARRGSSPPIPMNLARRDSTVDYVDTGQLVARRPSHGEALLRAGQRGRRCSAMTATTPCPDECQLEAQRRCRPTCTTRRTRPSVAWRFTFIPQTGSVPLVADYSSAILSVPLDVSRFGLIYAGAQKNIGPSGTVRRDRARGSARTARPADAVDLGLPSRWRRMARCSIRRPRSAGISPG